MSNVEQALIIFGMFTVTFAIRFTLFAGANKATIPNWLEAALKFVPVAVLTAIIAPMSLTNEQGLALNPSNPWFSGALAALIVGILLRRQLLTICVGVAVFFTVKLIA